jgi:hypothetical protein
VLRSARRTTRSFAPRSVGCLKSSYCDGVVLAMFVVGLTATWIPARRALLVDPLILLRDE